MLDEPRHIDVWARRSTAANILQVGTSRYILKLKPQICCTREEKEHQSSIRQDNGWAPEKIWTCGKIKIAATANNGTPFL